MKKLMLLSLAILGLVFVSCDKEHVVTVEEPEISQEIIAKVASLELNPVDMQRYDLELPNGEKMSTYLIEGCIAMKEDDLLKMGLHGGITTEQYRTYNLVSSPRTINIIGYTGSGYALSSKMQTALRWAVANYNRLNIGLYFNLTFGTNYQTKDIVVYQTSGAAGGVAGFPSGGNPYKWVQLFSGLNSYNTNVVEHVATHEIGHCVGFRHSDWWSRESCGSGGGESAGSIGAVHIPGTPTGADYNSIMEACFSSNEDGEFGYYDIVALEYLY